MATTPPPHARNRTGRVRDAEIAGNSTVKRGPDRRD
jgi:hypothetical protein